MHVLSTSSWMKPLLHQILEVVGQINFEPKIYKINFIIESFAKNIRQKQTLNWCVWNYTFSQKIRKFSRAYQISSQNNFWCILQWKYHKQLTKLVNWPKKILFLDIRHLASSLPFQILFCYLLFYFEFWLVVICRQTTLLILITCSSDCSCTSF